MVFARSRCAGRCGSSFEREALAVDHLAVFGDRSVDARPSFGIYQTDGLLGHWGSLMSDPRKPRIDLFPFMSCGFETFIHRDLIVRVRFLASLTFLRLVKTRTAYQK
jgi:hypothetical protein